jgi:hypothetical protein
LLVINADTLNIEGAPMQLTLLQENFSHQSTTAVAIESENAYLLSSGGGSRLGVFKLSLSEVCGPAATTRPIADPYGKTRVPPTADGYGKK